MSGLRVSIEEAVKRGWISSAAALSSASVGMPASRNAASPVAPAARPTAPGSRKRRVNHEDNAQIALLEQVAAEFPTLAHRLIHIPNGGKRTRFERYLFVKLGVKKGVPDLFLPVPRGPFSGLFIEMKANPPHSSPVSEDQKDWLAFLTENGFYATSCRGTVPALDIIRSYVLSREQLVVPAL